jgi:hypothetical protein
MGDRLPNLVLMMNLSSSSVASCLFSKEGDAASDNTHSKFFNKIAKRIRGYQLTFISGMRSVIR